MGAWDIGVGAVAEGPIRRDRVMGGKTHFAGWDKRSAGLPPEICADSGGPALRLSHPASLANPAAKHRRIRL